MQLIVGPMPSLAQVGAVPLGKPQRAGVMQVGRSTEDDARLRLEVVGAEDGPRGHVGDAVGGAVDAHGPVLGVMAALVQHRYQLARPPAALYVPGHRVAAGQHLVLQDVQPCSRQRGSLSSAGFPGLTLSYSSTAKGLLALQDLSHACLLLVIPSMIASGFQQQSTNFCGLLVKSQPKDNEYLNDCNLLPVLHGKPMSAGTCMVFRYDRRSHED